MNQASKIGDALLWTAMVDMFKTLRIERDEPSGPSQGMFIVIPSQTSRTKAQHSVLGGTDATQELWNIFSQPFSASRCCSLEFNIIF